MASKTIEIPANVYADGVTLGAYPAGNWPGGGQPSGAPVGSATDTSAVTGGEVTFDGLEPGWYWVTKTSSPYRYLSIFVPVQGTVMGAIVHGDDKTVPRPDFGVVTWIGSVEPDNMAVNDIWMDTSESE